MVAELVARGWPSPPSPQLAGCVAWVVLGVVFADLMGQPISACAVLHNAQDGALIEFRHLRLVSGLGRPADRRAFGADQFEVGWRCVVLLQHIGVNAQVIHP